PRVNGYHCDRVVEPYKLAHDGHGLRLRFVDGDEPSTEGRRSRHHRELHSPEPCVDAELRTAVDLASGVETPVRCADQLEVRRLLERNLLRHRQLRGGIDQLAVAELAAGG